MVKPVFDEFAAERPRRHFTVGIHDDVTHLSLPIEAEFRHPRPQGEVQALFFGLGSDGTVGANYMKTIHSWAAPLGGEQGSPG
ncbi:hypothetical protein BH23CHL8_BH23CHL8_09990 [soil metagenome]